MGFDLNIFRNKLKFGGARANQFEMRVNWPQQHVPQGIAAAADFPFLCSVAEIPSSSMGHIAVPYMGRKLQFAGDRDFKPLSVTVLNDEDFKIRRAFEAWMKAIAGHSTTESQFNGGITSDSYVTDGEVRQYSRNNKGSLLQGYKFVGMFPVELASIALDWNTQNEIETFTVTFQYQWWDNIDAATGQTLA